MTFSVIIPTYNRAGIIQGTLNSVLDQTFQDFEVIVVDDGSSDGTRLQVEALHNKKIRYYFKTNEERSVARNFGAERAEGRYLIFLDSDDRMRNDHLLNLYKYLLHHDFSPRFLFAGYVVYNPDGTKLYEYRKKGLFRKKKLLYGNYVGCSSVVVERELFRKHQFNTHPSIILFEDWELWLRIISETDLHCIPAGSLIMINHPGRSVLNYSVPQLVEKIRYFRQVALASIPLVAGSASARRTFNMGLYSYVALHVAMAKSDRKSAARYFRKALVSDPGFVTRRRFYGILKQLLF
jgi:glycosyltransferase involved in cell wall biosynthesis